MNLLKKKSKFKTLFYVILLIIFSIIIINKVRKQKKEKGNIGQLIVGFILHNTTATVKGVDNFKHSDEDVLIVDSENAGKLIVIDTIDVAVIQDRFMKEED